MKLKIKLSLMVIAIVIVVVSGIAIILLSEASQISTELSKRSLSYLAAHQAEYWQGRIDGHMRMLRTLSDIMEDFEYLPVELRREQFNRIIQSILYSNPLVTSLYTVWKPNAIDGMDDQFIGQPGSTETGQYAAMWTRETGELMLRTTGDIEGAMAHISGANARRERAENPTARRHEGRDTYAFRLMVPIINPQTNQVVGAVGCLISIEAIQPTLEETINTHHEITLMAIYSDNGFIIGHLFPERIGSFLLDVDTFFGDDIQTVNNIVNRGLEFSTTSFSQILNTYLEIEIASFEIGNSEQTWSVMVAARQDFVLAEVRQLTIFTIILAAIAIVVAAVILYAILHYTIKPIVSVTETLKDISQGEGDLTRIIPEKGKDEITALARYFNQTLAKIKNLIILIKEETKQLSDIGTDLAKNMNETASAVNQITANIQSIKGRVINQSTSVNQTNATMEQVTSNINKLNGNVEKQNGHVSQASAAIEEMVANVSSVTDTLVKNAANVKSLQEASEIGRNGLQEVSSDIQEIARESEGLLEINSVMENIASQTNLLSMNAAIEAAHAGEAGKGFAVVADEIRKLAESSSEQSKTIGSVLKKIKDSIDKITRSTENVLSRFEAIDTSVKTVVEQEDNIRNAMEEQGEGSKQILDGVGQLNGISKEVKNSSHQMLEGASEVVQECSNLEKVTQEITSGMNEMASGADQINVAVNHLNEISVKNREGINILMKEVARFKVE